MQFGSGTNHRLFGSFLQGHFPVLQCGFKRPAEIQLRTFSGTRRWPLILLCPLLVFHETWFCFATMSCQKLSLGMSQQNQGNTMITHTTASYEPCSTQVCHFIFLTRCFHKHFRDAFATTLPAYTCQSSEDLFARVFPSFRWIQFYMCMKSASFKLLQSVRPAKTTGTP